MSNETGFIKIYNKILPILKSAESDRKKELLKFGILEFLLIAFFCFVLIDYINNFLKLSKYDDFFIIITFFVFILGGFIIALPFLANSSFAKSIKASCRYHIIKCFDNLKWSFSKDIFTDDEKRESELFSVYNYKKIDDVFEGSHNGIDFKIAETELLDVQGSGKNRRVIRVFKGVIISFPYNKKIESQIIVTTRNDSMVHNKLNGVWALTASYILIWFLYYMFRDIKILICQIFLTILIIAVIILNFYERQKWYSIQEIKLEDPMFNKRFKVFAYDQVEARYHITPGFMERFLKLQTAFGTNKAKCSFNDGNIMFAISTNKNLFELGGLFTPLTSPKTIQKFYKELFSILDMIEYFKFDENTKL